jgi:hypothetical protein
MFVLHLVADSLLVLVLLVLLVLLLLRLLLLVLLLVVVLWAEARGCPGTYCDGWRCFAVSIRCRLHA